jgi:hypothetical protein
MMSGPGFIAVEPDGACELCGNVKELRPYGPGGANVCFDCGMKDEKSAQRAMSLRLFGEYQP